VFAIGYVVTLLTTPARLARANSCIRASTTQPPLRNTGRHHINPQYSLYSKAGPGRDLCRNTRLAPGDGLASLQGDLAALGGLFRIDMMACKAPYLPGQVQDMNNKRMKPACLSADESGVGPHISRQP